MLEVLDAPVFVLAPVLRDLDHPEHLGDSLGLEQPSVFPAGDRDSILQVEREVESVDQVL